MQVKKTIVALSVAMPMALAGVWYISGGEGEAEQSELGFTGNELAPIEQVQGANGAYPKLLTTDDLISGNVELPSQPDAEAFDPEDEYDAKAEAWAKVDFDELRSQMPDNQFWDMAMPTTDESVLDRRKAKRDALKVTEGRMMARHATEDEIQEYYAYQQALSEDYVEAITLLLNQYSDVLPEDDIAGQNLARTMHLSKLQEIPSQMTRAIEQRQAFLSEKAEWMADKAGYKARLEAEAAAANRELGKI